MKTLKDQGAQFAHNSPRHWLPAEIISECRRYVSNFHFLMMSRAGACRTDWRCFMDAELMWYSTLLQ